jgi:hypothetical protein
MRNTISPPHRQNVLFQSPSSSIPVSMPCSTDVTLRCRSESVPMNASTSKCVFAVRANCNRLLRLFSSETEHAWPLGLQVPIRSRINLSRSGLEASRACAPATGPAPDGRGHGDRPTRPTRAHGVFVPDIGSVRNDIVCGQGGDRRQLLRDYRLPPRASAANTGCMPCTSGSGA